MELFVHLYDFSLFLLYKLAFSTILINGLLDVRLGAILSMLYMSSLKHGIEGGGGC